jgi:hypothetical protein
LDRRFEFIEFVQVQGVKKRTEIHPKYKEKIEWNEAGDNSNIIPFDLYSKRYKAELHGKIFSILLVA